MSRNHLEERAQEMLLLADVRLNGPRAWDITVHNDKLYSRVFRHGSLGLGESYMDGWWDCPELDQFFCKIFNAHLERRVALSWGGISLFLRSILFNPQTKRRARKVAEQHYDLGNDLYCAMLDRRMVYTCARWTSATNLNQAQEAKLEFVCKKLGLQPGMKVLDIGCGWGSFAKYAAENYGVQVVGITLSRQQVELGRQLCRGLPVELRLEDYRDVPEAFDRVVSLGMFEHVGHKNYAAYFEMVRRALRPGGLFYLSTIGSNRTVRSTDPWIERYIFPNSHLPSIAQIGKAIEGRLLVEDWQNWGQDYDKTLMAWFDNFHSNWDKLKEKYSERFYRMWKFYLMSSAASFRARRLQVWQILLSPAGSSAT